MTFDQLDDTHPQDWDWEPAGRRDDDELPPLIPRSFAEFHGLDVPRHEFLVPEFHMFPRRKLSLFSGAGGIGKSTLMMQFGIARELRQPWMGFNIEAGRTLYVSCEDDTDDLHIRANRICNMHDAELADLEGFTYIDLVGQATELTQYNPHNKRMVPTPLCQRLEKAIATGGYNALILDGATQMFAGSEIDKVHVRQFMDILIALAKRYNLAVILLFHPSKSGIESGSGKSGSEAWHNLSRHRVYYSPYKAEGGEPVDDNLRTLQVVKNNYGPDGQSVTIRNDGGIFFREGQHSEKAIEFEIDCAFLYLLTKHADQGRKYSPSPSNNYGPKRLAETNVAREAGYSAKVLTRAMDRLLDAKQIVIIEDGYDSKKRPKLAVNRDHGRTLTMLHAAAQKYESS
jgi:RecA-family ATPase